MMWSSDQTIPETYSAWVRGSGGKPEELHLEDLPLPQPERGCALIANDVIGLNPVDWKLLGNASPGHTPGCDGAGRVIAVGENVPKAWIGQRVAYHTSLGRPGSFAELTPVPVRALMRVPPELDLFTAATMPCPALTAWQAVHKIPDRKDAEILISGAGGAVGLYALQFARARGFSASVICGQRHHLRMKWMGAEGVFTTADDVVTEGLKHQFHAVIDTAGAEVAQQLAPCLKANGHLVCVLGRVEQWPSDPFSQTWSLHEVALGALHNFGDDRDWADLTRAGETILTELAEEKIIGEDVVIKPFSELPHHLEALRVRSFNGKALVRVSNG
ncbi:alcohol dehydrogenase catalytic domain-containing protein [Salinicola rhizosphaerae]|uniref:Alcohol dehydrogenase n=1 Tax=Salinicola rhizosphaerae TaxID=1443141 RepID=A0ABQ3DM72_9GAMM|nr:zinc-binding dehydrogenase [Salinicola rhizosphaerae]GHB07563.1 alcohol dehydrogenase [Salinicola rhizosphaerae]